MFGQVEASGSEAGRRVPCAAPCLLALAALVATGCAAAAVSPRRTAGPIPLRRSSPPPAGARFEGNFESRLRALAPGTRVVALVDLTDQVAPEIFGAELRRLGLGKQARREAVIRALEEVAERQLAEIRPRIDRLISEGRLDYARGLAVSTGS